MSLAKKFDSDSFSVRESFLPFCSPSISDSDIDRVVAVLRSGWLTTGPNCTEFEERFAKYVGANGAVSMCSATAGLHLLLHALNLSPEDEIITPSLTWVSTPNLITLSGAKIVFADVDRDTLMVSRETIEPLVTPNTKVIIPVHYAGAACDMDGIYELAREKGILVWEDAAHAVGTEYKGVRVGASGTSIFSFHPIKNITTGEGGIICSDDLDLLNRIRVLRFHGLGLQAIDKKTQGRAPLAEVIEPGYKYNLTDLAATLGIGQLERVGEFNDKRTVLAHAYLDMLSSVEGVTPLGLPAYDFKHSWHLFPIRLDIDALKVSREEFMLELKKLNVGTGVHFTAAHRHKFYRESLGVLDGKLPNSDYNSERLVSLPLFPEMSLQDVSYVVDCIKAVLSS